MMRTAWFWAAVTLFWSGVATIGLLGIFLEAEGRGRWLGVWYGGVILAVISARQWALRRKRRRLGPPV